MKRKHNKNNVRSTKEYCTFLKEAKRQSESSIDGVLKAINRFEEYTNYKDFKLFRYQQAVGFKKHLMAQKSVATDKPLSKATLHTTLRHLKTFLQWLALQSGYRSRITYSDTEYFNLSEKDARIATAKRKKPVPTIEQVTQVLEAMPSVSNVELRDRALVAFTLLTGARDSAIASLKLKHVCVAEQSLYQDAREVNTKFSKTFTTYFFPVGELPLKILTEWVSYLQHELSFGPDDPLFPKTKIKNSPTHQFEVMGVEKEHWSTAGPIRRIFKQAFKLAELPYYNPHSFRNTLVRLGERLCNNAEEFKAWSQNLGHEKVLTTFSSYGDVADHRQAELLKKLAAPKPAASEDDAALLQRLLSAAREQGM
ncbi:tyrosine-type recombinase/integrase [Vibrio sp. 10N.222.54.F12]|uniref:tyrosine-type recombinase/integrase n=1 Tax=Vibrio TaxID=662 RepID=UPI000C820AE4|nr:site-specific integrase [Vibrio tasmaniensis]PML12955.1 recombinase XerC [Vibrio tasmaniensis]CAH7026663.1 Recombinase XerC [Vibrio chagasii]CAH7138566.1 Recombinase XerC [Vibrio chagasii]